MSQSRPQTLAALQRAGLGAMPIKQPVQEPTQEYDDRNSTTERTERTRRAVSLSVSHLLLTLARVSLSVSLFFSLLVATRRCRCLLRSDYR